MASPATPKVAGSQHPAASRSTAMKNYLSRSVIAFSAARNSPKRRRANETESRNERPGAAVARGREQPCAGGGLHRGTDRFDSQNHRKGRHARRIVVVP